MNDMKTSEAKIAFVLTVRAPDGTIRHQIPVTAEVPMPEPEQPEGELDGARA